jgi:hypothetical protein
MSAATGREETDYAVCSQFPNNKAYRIGSSFSRLLNNLHHNNGGCTYAEFGKDIYYEGYVNTSYLRSNELTAGVMFKFKGVYPRPIIEQIINCYKEQAQEIYKNLIVCYDVELTVNLDVNN